MGVKGGFSICGTPKMHNISGPSRVGHVYFGR